MVKLLQQMMTKLNTLENKVNNKENISNNGNKNSTVNPKTGKPWKRYCWTHGCGTHWSDKCQSPAPGHKNEATFKNRMGGATNGVLGA